MIDGRKVGYGMVWYGLKRERSGRNLRGGAVIWRMKYGVRVFRAEPGKGRKR